MWSDRREAYSQRQECKYEIFRWTYRFRENLAEKRVTIRASVVQTSRNKEAKKLVSFVWTIIFHKAWLIRLVIPGFMYYMFALFSVIRGEF